MTESPMTFQIVAVDCCEHVLAALSEGLPSRFTTITASDNARIAEADNKVAVTNASARIWTS